MNLEKQIRAYALKNALEHGKANPGKILPKLFLHGLEKKDIAKTLPIIKKIVDETNKLSKKEQESQFKKLENLIPEKEEEKEKTLPELPNVKGKVVTRMPPGPTKHLHIGHAISFLINYIYAKKYDGECILRFEDTDCEKVTKEIIESIKSDIQDYLKIKPSSITFVSDDMEKFYAYAEKLIKQDNAYMCFCDRDSMKNLRFKGKFCKCYKNSQEKNLKEWKKFLEGKYMDGETILRLKGDMKSKNSVLRDPVLFRAVKAPHYKYENKYKVWPLYDFYNAIEDSLFGVTHILRSNEFDQRTELQNLIKQMLGLKKQTVIHYGRFSVKGATTKGRETRELIESGEYLGWDDPRLVTLKALKRRGIKAESFYQLVEQQGLPKYQVNLDFDMIASINRKLIDPTSNRYSFVKDPIEIKIKNSPKIKEIKVPIHPKEKTTRTVKVNKIFISKDDFEKFKGQEIRLLHLYNIKLDKESTYVSTELKQVPKINWVSDGVKTKILMPDGKWENGLAEPSIKTLKNSETIQFERYGFVKLDKKEPSFRFWFTHK